MSKVFLFVAAGIVSATPKARANLTAHALCSKTIFAEARTKPLAHLSSSSWIQNLHSLGFKQIGQSPLFRHPGIKESVYLRLERSDERGNQPVFYAAFHQTTHRKLTPEFLNSVDAIITNPELALAPYHPTGEDIPYPAALRTPDILFVPRGGERAHTISIAGQTNLPGRPLRYPAQLAAEIEWQKGLSIVEKLERAGFVQEPEAPHIYTWHASVADFQNNYSVRSGNIQTHEALKKKYPGKVAILAEVQDGKLVRLLRPLLPFTEGVNRDILDIRDFTVTMGPGTPDRQEQIVEANLVLSDLNMKISYTPFSESIHFSWDPSLDVMSIPAEMLTNNFGFPLAPKKYSFIRPMRVDKAQVRDIQDITEEFHRGEMNSAETIRKLPVEPVYQQDLVGWLATAITDESRELTKAVKSSVKRAALADFLHDGSAQFLRINGVTLQEANERALEGGQLNIHPGFTEKGLLPLQTHLAQASSLVENVYHTTHFKLATPLLAGAMLTQMQNAGQTFLFSVHNAQFKVVEVPRASTEPFFKFPFDPEFDGERGIHSDLVFTRVSDGEQLRIPLGLAYTIAADGYYGSFSPKEIVAFFRLRFMTVHGPTRLK